jgi:hypothetical protein
MSEAVWRSVPGFEHYEVSSHGEVRSIDRDVPTRHHGWEGTRRLKGKTLKQFDNKDGYPVVSMGAKSKVYGVHQLVAWAFHGMPGDGEVIDHINGDKHDNRPENLEYVTPSENTKRQYRTGLLTNRAGEIGRWRHLPKKQECST